MTQMTHQVETLRMKGKSANHQKEQHQRDYRLFNDKPFIEL